MTTKTQQSELDRDYAQAIVETVREPLVVLDQKIKASGCYPGTIRKNNNPNKNYDLDRWRSHMRMPFEGTFSKLPKRARYRGQAKVAMQNFGQSICFNLKKAIQYLPPAAYN